MDSTRKHDEEDALVDAMLFSTYLIFPRVLHAAIRLDLFGLIAKQGPGAYVSVNWLASQLGAQNADALSMLDRMLRLFASHSLLSYTVKTLNDERVEIAYGLTPASKFFINDAKDEGSLSPFVRLSHKLVEMGVWPHLEDAILEGRDIFSRKHGMPMYEYMNKDPEFNTIFNEAMTSGTIIDTNAILEVYKGFDDIKSLVDVGGGTGKTLNMIISKYPSIKGINYDQPRVLQSAPQYPDIEHVGGNMLESIPNGEAIMIKNTCHNWNDEKVVTILRNVHKALPNGGKLIIISLIKSEEPDTTKSSKHVSRHDIVMLALMAGKERTALEFKALTEAAGFSKFHVVCIARSVWGVMEAFK